MRSLLILALCLLLAPFAAAKEPNSELESFEAEYKNFGAYKFFKGDPIKYFYEVIPSEPPQDATAGGDELLVKTKRAVKGAYYTEVIERTVKGWPSQVMQAIEKAERSGEFTDILPLLRGINLQRTNEAELADITFRFSDVKYIREVSKSTVSCGVWNRVGGRHSVIVMDPNLTVPSALDLSCIGEKADAYQAAQETALHEVGHFYGLADQYSSKNTSLVYSNSNRINRDSVMGSSYSTKLACDDVDGFIRLIDRIYAKENGRYGARAAEGWQSFCNDGTVYRNGKVLERAPYFRNWNIYTYTAQGDVAEKIEQVPFAPYTGAEVSLYADGLIKSMSDSAADLLLEYDYNLTDDPSVEITAYAVKDDLERAFLQYVRTGEKEWKSTTFKLHITDRQCHFTPIKPLQFTSIDIYVDRQTHTLSLVREMQFDKRKSMVAKIYDFKDGDYKCDFTEKDKNDKPVNTTSFEYHKQGDEMVLVEDGPLASGELVLNSRKETCMKPLSEYGGVSLGKYAAACEFFAEVESKLKPVGEE